MTFQGLDENFGKESPKWLRKRRLINQFCLGGENPPSNMMPYGLHEGDFQTVWKTSKFEALDLVCVICLDTMYTQITT